MTQMFAFCPGIRFYSLFADGIADTAYGLDQLDSVRLVELCADVADVDIYNVGILFLHIAGRLPDRLIQLRAGEHNAALLHQIQQQLKLRCGKRKQIVFIEDLPCVLVDADIVGGAVLLHQHRGCLSASDLVLLLES